MFEKENCPHYTDRHCAVIEGLSGYKVDPAPNLCRACDQCICPPTLDTAFHLITKKGGDTTTVRALKTEFRKGGPGTQLRRLLKDWWLKGNEDCDCATRADLMNQWGAKLCSWHRDTITGWLSDSCKKRFWFRPPKKPLYWVVDKAIDRARRYKAENPVGIDYVPTGRTLDRNYRAKVGQRLHAAVPGLFSPSGCGCLDYIGRMDRWGANGCTENLEQIVAHLVNKSAKVGINPLDTDTARQYVDEAIRDAANAHASNLPDNGPWYVAVTTAPRQNCDLDKTVESLITAGWTPHIFAEPGSHTHLTGIDLPTTHNPTRLGVWHNWLQAVRAALDTDAEYIMTVQDDALFHPDSRTFTESAMWPSHTTGFISLYTAKHYSYRGKNYGKKGSKYLDKNLRPLGINRVQTKSLWGAMALVFPRRVLEEMLEQPQVQNWLGARIKSRGKNSEVMARRKANPHLIQNSDTAIGKAILRMGRDLYFMDPSPVQHISPFSSIGHGGNGGKRNCHRCADHNVPLANQIPLNYDPVELIW